MVPLLAMQALDKSRCDLIQTSDTGINKNAHDLIKLIQLSSGRCLRYFSKQGSRKKKDYLIQEIFGSSNLSQNVVCITNYN